MPIGTQTVQKNQLLQFTVQANDPDGDMLTYSASTLPFGASFNTLTRLFSWIPDDSQVGNYTVVFYASDGNLNGQIAVAITVGGALTPGELVNQIVSSVSSLNLPKEVENSYLADIKKVFKFIQDGKITAAINQLQAFIKKVQTDVEHGIIGRTAGNNLINMATHLINMLNS